jgi:two-component system, OmpR family, sensor histidine kinase BaeS
MPERRRVLGPIGARLALATVAVAIGAIGVLAALTLVAARGDVSQLARQEQEQYASATAKAVADAYGQAGSWKAARLRTAAVLAADSQSTLTVLDSSGHPVSVPAVTGASSPRVLEGPVRTYPVVFSGKRVGTTIVHFYRANLPTPETHLRNALVHTVAAGAVLGALLALAVAVVLSRWITRPIAALTQAVRSMEAGDRTARVGVERGSGELAELATAFDNMAATVAREDELRRAVVADVAHELRTPLSILQADSESLADGAIDPSQHNLNSLHEEVLRLARIVEDLDTLASAEAAVLRMDLQTTDLSDVAVRAIDLLLPSYRAQGVRLLSELSPVKATVDPDRVDQILKNLLSNALKFTDPGGSVTVTVRSDAGSALLEVSDTGAGIASDELPHVFERFWRGRQAGRVAGSGIGLAVVHTLVEAHQGSVSVTSEPDAGTRFVVGFPQPGG